MLTHDGFGEYSFQHMGPKLGMMPLGFAEL